MRRKAFRWFASVRFDKVGRRYLACVVRVCGYVDTFRSACVYALDTTPPERLDARAKSNAKALAKDLAKRIRGGDTGHLDRMALLSRSKHDQGKLVYLVQWTIGGDIVYTKGQVPSYVLNNYRYRPGVESHNTGTVSFTVGSGVPNLNGRTYPISQINGVTAREVVNLLHFANAADDAISALENLNRFLPS